jgi:ABC-2 type transport system ATP-binding protein
MNMIEINDLTKTFQDITAVNHVSLEIPEGQVFGLLGTNGAGKSTLLRMLSGILKPDGGTILIDGIHIWDNPRVKENCFYLSDKQYFFPNASPEAMGRFYRGLYPSFCLGRYLDLLDDFDFDRFRKIRTFSKGMKKQIAVFASICAETPYIFCDEVFDGLDPVIRQSVTALIKSEMKRRPLTPVIASHNLKELEDFCDQIGILHKGGVLLSRDIHSMQYKTQKLQCILKEEQLSRLLDQADLVSVKQEGFLTTLLLRGSRGEITSFIEQFQPERYAFLPLTLEEIFINETEAIGYDIKLLFS